MKNQCLASKKLQADKRKTLFFFFLVDNQGTRMLGKE